MSARPVGGRALALGALAVLLLLPLVAPAAGQTGAFETTTALSLQEAPTGGRSAGTNATWSALVEYCHSAAGWATTRNTRITLTVLEVPRARSVQLNATELSANPRATGPETVTCHELPFSIQTYAAPGTHPSALQMNVTIRAVAEPNPPLHGSEGILSFQGFHPPTRPYAGERGPAGSDGATDEAYHLDRGGPLRGYGVPLLLVLAGVGGLVLRRRAQNR